MHQQIRSVVYLLTLVAVAIAASGCIIFYWQAANAEIEAGLEFFQSYQQSSSTPREKPPKQTVKAVYLTAYSAGSPKKLDEIIDLIEHTELNAVVIDIKDYSGLVLYNSHLPQVVKWKLKDNRYPDLAATVKKLHDHHIYVIARQTVFQDPVLAAAKPEWALKDKRGGLWHDLKGLSWVDATKKEVWRYNLAIAKEAATYGFDEINFDYIRFPSDGDMKNVEYSNTTDKKYAIMRSFYEYLSNQMASEPVWTSFDMFGFVMEKTGEDDMNIGQRLVDAVSNTDYVCPMMYPSHYPPGHLNMKNPATEPTRVFENGMQKGMPQFTGARAEVRPWIQAFNLGAVYDAEKIRAQIDVVEKYTSAGWLMWNAANRYTDAGLKAE